MIAMASGMVIGSRYHGEATAIAMARPMTIQA